MRSGAIPALLSFLLCGLTILEPKAAIVLGAVAILDIVAVRLGGLVQTDRQAA
jgi:hypothetical protein